MRQVANQLYFGDNLHVLREHVRDESIDLIYLDPPFNSKRDYNILFKSPKGHQSDAQITAFDDTWVEREGAQLGLFVTLAPPNKPMETEAIAAGFYESPHFAPVQRIQILTIEGLMRGTERARYPDVAAGAHTFKKARGEQQAAEQGNLFGAAEAADRKVRYRTGK